MRPQILRKPDNSACPVRSCNLRLAHASPAVFLSLSRKHQLCQTRFHRRASPALMSGYPTTCQNRCKKSLRLEIGYLVPRMSHTRTLWCTLKPPFHEASTHAALSMFMSTRRIPRLPRGHSQTLSSVMKAMLNLN
ncbi:hypothetical protein OG21DRAFT_1534243, partial [Imleria badia]